MPSGPGNGDRNAEGAGHHVDAFGICGLDDCRNDVELVFQRCTRLGRPVRETATRSVIPDDGSPAREALEQVTFRGKRPAEFEVAEPAADEQQERPATRSGVCDCRSAGQAGGAQLLLHGSSPVAALLPACVQQLPAPLSAGATAGGASTSDRGAAKVRYFPA